jgi:hypothetical protein
VLGVGRRHRIEQVHRCVRHAAQLRLFWF